MPFDGTVEPADTATNCVIVSSADVPAYLFITVGVGWSGNAHAAALSGPGLKPLLIQIRVTGMHRD
jgi:hypothetical protein